MYRSLLLENRSFYLNSSFYIFFSKFEKRIITLSNISDLYYNFFYHSMFCIPFYWYLFNYFTNKGYTCNHFIFPWMAKRNSIFFANWRGFFTNNHFIYGKLSHRLSSISLGFEQRVLANILKTKKQDIKLSTIKVNFDRECLQKFDYINSNFCKQKLFLYLITAPYYKRRVHWMRGCARHRLIKQSNNASFLFYKHCNIFLFLRGWSFIKYAYIFKLLKIYNLFDLKLLRQNIYSLQNFNISRHQLSCLYTYFNETGVVSYSIKNFFKKCLLTKFASNFKINFYSLINDFFLTLKKPSGLDLFFVLFFFSKKIHLFFHKRVAVDFNHVACFNRFYLNNSISTALCFYNRISYYSYITNLKTCRKRHIFLKHNHMSRLGGSLKFFKHLLKKSRKISKVRKLGRFWILRKKNLFKDCSHYYKNSILRYLRFFTILGYCTWSKPRVRLYQYIKYLLFSSNYSPSDFIKFNIFFLQKFRNFSFFRKSTALLKIRPIFFRKLKRIYNLNTVRFVNFFYDVTYFINMHSFKFNKFLHKYFLMCGTFNFYFNKRLGIVFDKFAFNCDTMRRLYTEVFMQKYSTQFYAFYHHKSYIDVYYCGCAFNILKYKLFLLDSNLIGNSNFYLIFWPFLLNQWRESTKDWVHALSISKQIVGFSYYDSISLDIINNVFDDFISFFDILCSFEFYFLKEVYCYISIIICIIVNA